MRTFLIVGCILILSTAFTVSTKIKYIVDFKTAEGEVIKISRITKNIEDSGYHEVYSAVVKFNTSEGSRYEFKGEPDIKLPEQKVGDRVTVIYNPEDPFDARINDFTAIWGSALIQLLLALILIGVYKRFEEK